MILFGVQALDLHIATECFMREFWDMKHDLVTEDEAALKHFTVISGSSATHDLPHCEVTTFLISQA